MRSSIDLSKTRLYTIDPSLLFVAYAEDKDLLPYKTNESYRSRSLKEKARELASLAERGTDFDTSSSRREET